MNLLLCTLAFALAYVSADRKSWFDTSLIVGGKPVRIEDYPYQVSVLIKPTPEDDFAFNCGGSIYSDRIILTAAHCIEGRNVSSLQVTAGSKYIKAKCGVVASVKETIVHENHNPDTQENDIAIMVLSAPLPLNNRTMKAIPLVENGPITGAMGTISGWGQLKENGEFPKILQAVQVPIVSNQDCGKEYAKHRKIITKSMVCAGYQGVGGKDTCTGDSGGPMAVNGKLAGISSWGSRCASPDFPGVYTNVFYFRTWILQKISKINCH